MRLAALLRGGGVFANWVATYGRTPAEMRKAGLSVRELLALTAGIPAGSPAWSQTHAILADLVDAVYGVRQVLMLANTDKAHRSRLPEMPIYPRPGVKKEAKAGWQSSRSFSSPAEFEAWRAKQFSSPDR